MQYTGREGDDEGRNWKEFTEGVAGEVVEKSQSIGRDIMGKITMDMEIKDSRSNLKDMGIYQIDNFPDYVESSQQEKIEMSFNDKSDGDQLVGGCDKLNQIFVEKEINKEDPVNLGIMKGELMNFPKWKRFPRVTNPKDSIAMSVMGKQKLTIDQVAEGAVDGLFVLENKKVKIDDYNSGNTEVSAILNLSSECIKAPSSLGSTAACRHANWEQ